MSAAIETHDLFKCYRRVRALTDCTVTVPEGPGFRADRPERRGQPRHGIETLIAGTPGDCRPLVGVTYLTCSAAWATTGKVIPPDDCHLGVSGHTARKSSNIRSRFAESLVPRRSSGLKLADRVWAKSVPGICEPFLAGVLPTWREDSDPRVEVAVSIPGRADAVCSLNLARLEDASQPMDGSDQDDTWLVRRVASGDRDALAALYQRHARVVLAQVTLVVGEPTLSEEILQDTMLAVWRGAASFRGEAAVRSWIIAIARRQARDRLRRRPARAAADIADLSGLPASEAGPEDAVIVRAEAEVLADAAGQLGPLHREVLGLVFGVGLTMAEAATVLDVPVGTVKSRLYMARVALARALAEKGYTR